MFLDYLGTRKDVYMVSVNQAIEWVKNPTKLEDIRIHRGPLSCPLKFGGYY